jgi:phosphomannomutase
MTPSLSTPAQRLQRIFKAYDVRGVVPDEMDASIAAAVGAAFASFVRDDEGAARVVIGRDMRESGQELALAFAAGVLSEGLGVVDIGLVSTDLCYFASGSLGLPGAMLTASHNPARYNGIKLCRSAARPIGEQTGLATIRDRAATVLASMPAPLATPEPGDDRIEHLDLLDAFAAHVHSFADLSALRPLRIVADTANGMGGLTAPRVLGGLGFELDILYGELDGNFPNHPADPIQVENLRDLQARVTELGADVGLAFDGDADRVFLIDELGMPLSGSLTTAIVAAEMLDANPGETVLYNLICSKAVPEVIAEHTGHAVRTRVGHSFIKTVMAETGAIFGGEHSGHYYFRENFCADSGIIAAMIVLGLLSREQVPLSELRKPYERYADSGEINTEVRDIAAVLAGVREEFAARGAGIDTLDGLTIDLGSWWFNLRPSNTEPLLRLNLEAPNATECAARVDEVLGLVRSLGAPTSDEGTAGDGA